MARPTFLEASYPTAAIAANICMPTCRIQLRVKFVEAGPCRTGSGRVVGKQESTPADCADN